MPLESSPCLYALLGAVALLLASGIASVLAGRWSERLSVAFGSLGAAGACLAGLMAAIVALGAGAEGTFALPWRMPYGSF